MGDGGVVCEGDERERKDVAEDAHGVPDVPPRHHAVPQAAQTTHQRHRHRLALTRGQGWIEREREREREREDNREMAVRKEEDKEEVEGESTRG